MANKRKQKGRKQKKVFRVSEIIWALEQNGWVMTPMRDGDHRQFHKAGNPHVITVAGKLSHEVPRGIIANIQKKSGLRFRDIVV